MIRHAIPLILCLVTLSYGTTGVTRPTTPLHCQECSMNVTKYAGVVSRPVTKYCVLKACEEGVEKCVSGHANIAYVQDFEGHGDVNVEIVMDYFKGCGDRDFSSCAALKKMIALKVGDAAREVTVEGCEMEACEEDSCNDKTPDEINPDRLKQISCYTCSKTTINGTDAVDDQPTCSEEHQETCPLGVETCYAGSMAVTVDGTKYDTEYFKSCGAGDSTSTGTSNCEGMKEFLQGYDTGEFEKCNVKSCEGDLCNTADVGGGGFPPSAVGSLIATVVLLHVAVFYRIYRSYRSSKYCKHRADII